MAIAVPILASAFGASAAIGTAIGISANLVTLGIGVLTSVSGIGAKIDKAAAKVFGKDLVLGANLIGGFAMAAGWNPADGLSLGGLEMGSAAGGTSAGSIDGLGASIDAAGGVDAFANGGVNAAAGFDPMVSDMAGNVGSPSQMTNPNAAAGTAATKAAVAPGGAPKGVLESVGKWYDKQPDRIKAALVTTAGNAVAGAAQGYASSKEQQALIDERRRRERMFNTGSQTNFTYRPGVLPQTGG